MSRIFKYSLQIKHREIVQMPASARIISVVWQNGLPFLYAVVEDEGRIKPRIIRTVTTGEIFNEEGCRFIGTLQGGSPQWFVAHVFEQYAGSNDPVSDRFANDFRAIGKEI